MCVCVCVERRTVDLFQAGLFWNGGRCVFVERAPVAREVELLVDIDVLIAEDLRPWFVRLIRARFGNITDIRRRALRLGAT